MVEKMRISEQNYRDGVHNFYSHRDYISQTMPVMNRDEKPRFCAGCGIRIVEKYYLMAADRVWHLDCLKCCDCNIRLDTELTCFSRDENIYCKEDYYRRFSVKTCAKCNLGISANELVMRARDHVFHLSCFTCWACNKTLTTGDYFGMKENLIYCKPDYELLFQGDGMQNLSSGIIGPPAGDIPFYSGVKRTQKGRPRKRKITTSDGNMCTQQHLGKMILFVWFQNARAKHRRQVMKHDGEKSESGADAQTEGVTHLDGEKSDDSKTFVDISNNSSSEHSNMSSTPSLSDIQNGMAEYEPGTGTRISDLFSSTLNSLN
ncbi:hypothetical protein ACJMK2_039988 [Sinanodonta woodiana]|uniref:LIM zinc-binding domain-containing protein n=1 Tax=Sinanodonta woodiana TaxID=1069815 RepID=A0ABD3WEV5_SINWO